MKICVIGLGYVGLPLAVEFAKKFEVIGFDISELRIGELRSFHDRTREVEPAELKSSKLKYSNKLEDIKSCNIFIITVPTPIDGHNNPDLTPILKASETVGKILKKGDIVVYESTVYPGCTEEDCVPVLEKHSNLKFNQDFFCGYSPERVNPGDKEHTVAKIKKVVSGSTPEIAKKINELYGAIITAGTYLAPSIKIAEAAKVIENTQRDINIAFVNELSMIFHRVGIDTNEVLKAAATKWNFLPFKPGLVGGHCIGVDPYYLTFKAQSLGYHPEVILSGRRINDNMGAYVANQIIKLMIKKSHAIKDAKVLVLGITFKENCPDIRNSKVIDVIKELKDFDCKVDVYDPWALTDEVEHEYDFKLVDQSCIAKIGDYAAVVIAVGHKQFAELHIDRKNFKKTVVFDLKGILPIEASDGRL